MSEHFDEVFESLVDDYWRPTRWQRLKEFVLRKLFGRKCLICRERIGKKKNCPKHEFEVKSETYRVENQVRKPYDYPPDFNLVSNITKDDVND